MPAAWASWAITWSCNAKANVPRKTLEIMRENGLRLLLVGYESGNQQILNNIKKGTRLDIAREFTRNARELGITIHGTFILGLAGRNAGNDPRDDSLCLRHRARNHPGFACRALSGHGTVPSGAGAGLAADSDRRTGGYARRANRRAELPTISSTLIFNSVEEFYRKFYFRPRKIFSLVGGMVRSPDVMRRRLREGVEFFRFLHERKKTAQAPPAPAGSPAT